ncbi:condensation domain-containing protein, partial [Streptomyces sp. AC550_RSS872]|uniref:condensation domain-containing protein n=1 Tax=Streptomyces sp. AC550_RSS872 TaxID=2823689 RepID=UPI001C257718
MATDPVGADELRSHLAASLPGYMVPGAFVALEALPLTPNGKLDRKALPEPDQHAQESGRPPRTPTEETLARLFAQTLGVRSVSIDDGFFDLGGDSIMSIQLVSRAQSSGIGFSVRDVFEQQTVAALAAICDSSPTQAQKPNLEPIGSAPLTAIMREFLERGGPVNEYNQSILLTAPADATAETITAALQAVLDHHDSLRLRLHADGRSGFTTEILPVGAVRAADHLTHIDATHHTTPETLHDLTTHHAAQARTHLNPHHAHNLHALYLDHGPHQPAHLALIAHHLVIDGVSWRILLDDLATAHRQVIAHEAPGTLPATGTPWRHWATTINDRAGDPHLQDQLSHWTETLSHPPLLVLDPAQDTHGTAGHHTAVLDAETTRALLTWVPGLYNATVNDLLLTAFSLATARWHRDHPHLGHADRPVTLTLESHGRHEHLAPGADLARTTGWFTTAHPVRLHPRTTDWTDAWNGGPSLGHALKLVKEQIRTTPQQGAGYGLLRYLNNATKAQLAGLPTPQYAFNYLGRIATSANADAAWSMVAADIAGTHADTPLAHPVTLNAITHDADDGPQLQAAWTYAGRLVTEDEMRALADYWLHMLKSLVTHGRRADAGGLTPSDVAHPALTQGHIDELEASGPPLEDVLPLSPLQEGFAFHHVMEEHGLDVYTAQLSLDLEGAVDSGALRAAAHTLLQRHANLRAAFVQQSSGEWLQTVRREVPVPWREADLSALSTDEQDTRARRIAEEDRWTRFDLARPPLLRLTLLRLGEYRYRFLLTNHHILLDGWSLPIVVRELLSLYMSGSDTGLPRVMPYRNYLAWLAERDHEAARDAWSAALGTLDGPTLIAPEAGPVTTAPERLSFYLDQETTDQLARWASSHDLTLNTVLQGAWALALAHTLNRTDITFGTTVSGRPAELPGVESMVGLFINTVPVHTRPTADQDIVGYLTGLQRQQNQLLDHQWVSLAEIQRWTGHKKLFDTAMVFENYPVDVAGTTARLEAEGLRLTRAEGADATDSVLHLVVFQRESGIELRLDYRTDACEKDLAESVGTSAVRALRAIAADPEQSLARLELIDPAERHQLLEEWNGQQVETAPVDVVALFEEQAAATPNAVALTCAGQDVTYAELNARANQLGRHLAAGGVGPEQFVTVGIPRGPDLITALVAIVKSGAAYVPIDPDYPAERIAHILND